MNEEVKKWVEDAQPIIDNLLKALEYEMRPAVAEHITRDIERGIHTHCSSYCFTDFLESIRKGVIDSNRRISLIACLEKKIPSFKTIMENVKKEIEEELQK